MILIWLYPEKPSVNEDTSQPMQSSIIWWMKRVGKLSFGQALFNPL